MIHVYLDKATNPLQNVIYLYQIVLESRDEFELEFSGSSRAMKVLREREEFELEFFGSSQAEL